MNSVAISVVLKKAIDEKFRVVEYQLLNFNENNEDSQEIVAKYWPSTKGPEFVKLPEGTFLLIRGHLDKDKVHGTILVVETYEKLKLAL